MIILSFLIGIYAYSLYILGLLGLLHPLFIGVLTLLFAGSVFYLVIQFKNRKVKFVTFSPQESALLFILILQAAVTLIGVLGPEIAFDALWYHLTLPKLYLEFQSIPFIPGSLFYYSEMPKLTEMLYIPALLFADERLAKFIHYLFGIGICILLFSFSRTYVSRLYALLTVLLFSSNLIVGWEAITAYVDLARTYFELSAFVVLFIWLETRKTIYVFFSAALLGLAISTKLLAVTSLPLFLLLIITTMKKNTVQQTLRTIGIFSFLAIVIPLPWFFRSYQTTGNPFYPFLTTLYPLGSEYNFFNPVQFFQDIWLVFTSSPDPISPLYVLSLPVILVAVLSLKDTFQMRLTLISLASLVIWFILPRVGGGRFLLPYLPIYSLVVVYCITQVKKIKYMTYVRRSLITLIIFYAFVFIGYRFVANSKFIPVIMGYETKADFLKSHLNFSYGDFYDIDGYFQSTIKQTDTVLLIGFHNLYYVDFPYVHESYADNNNYFTHIAVQNSTLPEKYNEWKEVYSNSVTNVTLYTKEGHGK